jgi:hypothetical protein
MILTEIVLCQDRKYLLASLGNYAKSEFVRCKAITPTLSAKYAIHAPMSLLTEAGHLAS